MRQLLRIVLATAKNERGRTALASVIAAVLLPFILIVLVLIGLLDGASTHNVSVVDLTFHGGVISEKVPDEYRRYIEEMRGSFSVLDDLIDSVENLEDGDIDCNRVKSVFFSLYFGADQPSQRVQKEFLDCFLRYEERVLVTEMEMVEKELAADENKQSDEDHSDTEEETLITTEIEAVEEETIESTEKEEAGTYLAAIFLTDMDEVKGNLEAFLGESLSDVQMENADRIYTLAVYGRVSTPGMIAGLAMGNENFQKVLAEGRKYIGYPYVWGGSTPSTSFDCSGYICWIFTRSGVYYMPRTTAAGIFRQCAVVSRGEAQPGDLVFFAGTYISSEPVTHVGLYLGGNKMLHCGDPIGYADLDASYWRSHFYAFGRLPGVQE